MTFWTDEKVFLAKRLWNQGAEFPHIVAEVGCTRGQLASFALRNRQILPARREGRLRKKAFVEQAPAPIEIIRLSEGIERVTRTTITGAKVTMPRVSFIDGPAESTSPAYNKAPVKGVF